MGTLSVVKFERLLKVPRSARTIQLVINIPDAPAHPPTISAKLTRQARVWSFLKIAGPALVATVAIIISILSFREQSFTDQTQHQSAQREEAEQVTFVSSAASDYIQVENLGTTPAYSAELEVNADSSYGFRTYFLDLGSIPPCSTGMVSIPIIEKFAAGQLAEKKSSSKEIIVMPVSMYFSDANSIGWIYSGEIQGLQQWYPPRAFPTPITVLPGVVSYKAASSCA